MEDERTLIIGFDLCDDFSQISCIPKNLNEPESVCITPDKTKYLIPTAVCYREGTGEWLIGEEAERCRDRRGGIYAENLLSGLQEDRLTDIYGTNYPAKVLMEKFFRKILGIIRQKFQNNSIRQLVVTLELDCPETEEKLYAVMETLGIGRDRVRIIGHTLSFMYYTVSQSRDLWMNDVALFDYAETGLQYCQLTFGRKSVPNAVIAERIDLSETIPWEMLSERPIERLAHSFESVAGLTLHKKIISSVYVTGRGFEGNWSDDVLRGLCMGRRVFKGQNLYTKGACYAARAISQNRLNDFLFLPEDRITSSISLKVYHNTTSELLPLATVGEPWRTGGGECTLILDQCNELEFTVNNAIRRDALIEVMILDGPIRRENKSIRLELKLYFMDRDTAVVRIRDTGFGDFFKTSHRIWEQVLKL